MNRTKVIRSIIAMFLILIAAGGALAASYVFDGSRSFTLKSGASRTILCNNENITVIKRVRVRAKANQGNVAIKVFDPRGKTVAKGTNAVSFKTGKTEGKYKIVVTNNTKKMQKVTLSYTATDDLFGFASAKQLW